MGISLELITEQPVPHTCTGGSQSAPTFCFMLTGGFQRMFLVEALNYQPGLSVRNGSRLLVPVDAFDIVRLLYAALLDCQAGKLWYSRNMNTRQATADDSLTLSRLCRDVQDLHAQNHADIFKMPNSDDFAVSFFEEMLADPAVTVFIAEQNGDAVGYILCKLIERPESPFTFAARILHIDQISVRPAARGQGVGAALIQRAELLSKGLNVQRIQLDSWDFNLNAHAFFERLGFEKYNFRFWRKL